MSSIARAAFSFLSKLGPSLSKGIGSIGGFIAKGLGKIGPSLSKGVQAVGRFISSGSAAQALNRGASIAEKAAKAASVGLTAAAIAKEAGIIPESAAPKVEAAVQRGQRAQSGLFGLGKQLRSTAGSFPQPVA